MTRQAFPYSVKNDTSFFDANVIKALLKRHSSFGWAGLVLLALMVPTLLLMSVDTRLVHDVNTWLKPLKFQFSLGVYFVTLAWFVAYTSEQFQLGRWMRWATVAGIVAVIVEVGYITFQAALGQDSHFNDNTVFNDIMYSVMGMGAVTLTSVSMVMGVGVLRNKTQSLDAAFKLSVGLGLILTFILGTIAGGASSVGITGTGPLIGASEYSKSGGLPFLGWSREYGDLRVSHFFGIHAMHVLPLIGWGLAKAQVRARVTWVWLSAIAFTVFTAFTFLQALNGEPFLPFIG